MGKENIVEEMNRNMEEFKTNYENLMENDNKSAGRRARKNLAVAKKLAVQVRKDIQEKLNSL